MQSELYRCCLTHPAVPVEDDASLPEAPPSVAVLLEPSFSSTSQIPFAQLPTAVGINLVATFFPAVIKIFIKKQPQRQSCERQ